MSEAKYKFIPSAGYNFKTGEDPKIVQDLDKLAETLHENIYGTGTNPTGAAIAISVGNEKAGAKSVTETELQAAGLWRSSSGEPDIVSLKGKEDQKHEGLQEGIIETLTPVPEAEELASKFAGDVGKWFGEVFPKAALYVGLVALGAGLIITGLGRGTGTRPFHAVVSGARKAIPA